MFFSKREWRRCFLISNPFDHAIQKIAIYPLRMLIIQLKLHPWSEKQLPLSHPPPGNLKLQFRTSRRARHPTLRRAEAHITDLVQHPPVPSLSSSWVAQKHWTEGKLLNGLLIFFFFWLYHTACRMSPTQGWGKHRVSSTGPPTNQDTISFKVMHA